MVVAQYSQSTVSSREKTQVQVPVSGSFSPHVLSVASNHVIKHVFNHTDGVV